METRIRPRKDYLESDEVLEREGGLTNRHMQRSLIYLQHQGKYFAALYLGGELEQLRVYDVPFSNAGKVIQRGDIYLAKVRNVMSNLQAAFVDVMPGVSCYLPLEKEMTFSGLCTNRETKQIKPGDEVVVQIVREAMKTKQPSVSGRLHLDNVNVTEESVFHKACFSRCYEKLYEQKAELYVDLADWLEQYEELQILTDDRMIFDVLHSFLKTEHPIYQHMLKYYEDEKVSLTALYSFEKDLIELTSRKVWLKSGGYLVIDVTEAMIVIDVNSGKCVKNKITDEYIRMINKEAAQEIFRQLKLRNLSGMILVDFISFKEKANAKEFLEECKHIAAQQDKWSIVHDMTILGIVEITRKKRSKTLKEQLI